MGGITHSWNGTILTITSDSGTSSADLKGEKGDDGARGAQGATGFTIGNDGLIDTSNFATKQYVDESLANIEINSDSITQAYVEQLINDSETNTERYIDNKVTQLSREIDDVNSDLINIEKAFFIKPYNLYNKKYEGSEVVNGTTYNYENGIIQGLTLNSNTGELQQQSDRYISYPVAVDGGKTVYLKGYDGQSEFISIFIFSYDKYMNYIGVNNQFTSSYELPQNAAYIRFTMTNNFFGVKGTVCYDNNYGSEYQEYFEPYYADEIARNMAKQAYDLATNGGVNTHIIDCWGDSRTEMIWNQGTSYTDKLQSLLGDNYVVTNHGISSQASGMITARMGVNELYVSVVGSTSLNDTGSTDMNLDYCSSGDKRNVVAWSDTSYIKCELCGVRGNFARVAGSVNAKFIPDDNKTSRKIVNHSKLIPIEPMENNHIIVAWFGKNDMGSAGNAAVSGVLANYKAIVDKIGHNKFVFLGETYSMDRETYGEGSTYRTNADAITNGLRELYPDNFIDIQQELINRGLSICGLTETTEDREWMNLGFIPLQLMNYHTSESDAVHPNAYGRQAIGQILYDFMVEKGWVD